MVAALTLAVALVAGCSASNDSAASNPPSTPSSGGTSPTSTAKGAAGVVTIDGTDDRTVNLPSGLKLPLIVHAHSAGPGTFVVRSVDDTGSALQVLATGFAYDGTFAVGFLDPRRQPTVGLRVSATGAWHLDIASARLAPHITGGLTGLGDAVFSYVGKSTTATVTHNGQSSFVISSYGADGLTTLVEASGPYQGRISLPNGPVFVSVTADGHWSITSP